MIKKSFNDYIEFSLGKKFWIVISIAYIVLISSIVFAVDPSVYGHDSSKINGLTWNGNVGELTYNDSAFNGGHSTSELQDVVWFNENGQQIGVILKNQSTSKTKFFYELILNECYDGTRNCENRLYNFFMISQILDGDIYSKFLINATKFNGNAGEILKTGSLIKSANQTYEGILTFKTNFTSSPITTQNFYYYVVYSNVSVNSKGISFNIQTNYCGSNGTVANWLLEPDKYLYFDPKNVTDVSNCKQESLPRCKDQIMTISSCAGVKCRICYSSQKVSSFNTDLAGWL